MFLRHKFFTMLQFLGNFLRDFLRSVFDSVPILHTNLSSLFEPDQPIDSPVVAVIVEIRVLDECHKEQYQNFSFSISASASGILF